MKRCHGCNRELSAPIAGKLEDSATTITFVLPCEFSPEVCLSCRANKQKFKAAREAMEKHFESGCPGGARYTVEKPARAA